jgi:hypothetical protein
VTPQQLQNTLAGAALLFALGAHISARRSVFISLYYRIVFRV